MEFNASEGRMRNILGLIFVICMGLVFMIIAQISVVYIFSKLNHITIRETFNLLVKPDGTAMSINLSRYSALIPAIGSLLLPALLFFKVDGTKIKHIINAGNTNKQTWKYVLMIVILSFPAVDFLTELTHQLPFGSRFHNWALNLDHKRQGQLNTILDMAHWSEIFVCIFIVALVPAISEELMFRGVVFSIAKKMFAKTSVFFAIVFQAIIFTAMHLSVYEFLGILFMGLIFGIIVHYGKSLLYTIISHFLFNGFSVIIVYFSKYYKGGNSVIADFHFPWYIGLLSLVAICSALYYQFIKVASDE